MSHVKDAAMAAGSERIVAYPALAKIRMECGPDLIEVIAMIEAALYEQGLHDEECRGCGASIDARCSSCQRSD